MNGLFYVILQNVLNTLNGLFKKVINGLPFLYYSFDRCF